MPNPPVFISLMFCLDTEQGHIYSYNVTFGKAVRQIGGEHRAAVRAAAKVTALPAGWQRCLGAKKNFFETGWLSKIEKEIRLIATLAQYLNQHLKTHPPTVTILFVEWFNLVHLIALAGALLFVPRRQNLRLWMVYRFLFQRRLIKAVYLGVHTILKLLLGVKHINLFTETDSVAQSLTAIFQQPLTLLPMPQIISAEEPTTLPTHLAERTQGKLVCWWPGIPAADKGLTIIEKIARWVSPAATRICLIADQKTGFQALSGGCDIILLDHLTRAEYIGWMRTTQIALLPYSPAVYADRTSGVFADALALGTIPLVTESTWMARELRRYHLDELIVDWTREDLLEYFFYIGTDRQVRLKLDAMLADYKLFHSIAGYASVLTQAIKLA